MFTDKLQPIGEPLPPELLESIATITAQDLKRAIETASYAQKPFHKAKR